MMDEDMNKIVDNTAATEPVVEGKDTDGSGIGNASGPIGLSYCQMLCLEV